MKWYAELDPGLIQSSICFLTTQSTGDSDLIPVLSD